MVNRSILGCVALLLGVSGSVLAQNSVTQLRAATSSQAFSENRGQWDSQARFFSKIPGLNLWVTGDGLVLDYHKFVPAPNQKRDPHNRFWQPKGTTYGDVVRMTLVSAQPTVVSGQGLLNGDENYFIGNVSSRWASGVHRYSEAKAEQPYPGVAVRYYFDQGAPRYDLVASSGADLSQVGFKVEGVQGMQVLPNGDLELQTPYGVIEEKGLRAYQGSGGKTSQVPCRMVIDQDVIRFDIGSYDPSRPVVVDPLVFSTYFSGASFDTIQAVKIDSSKNIVVAGSTTSATFPTTTGAYQKTVAGAGIRNVFISRLNSSGTTLVSSTLLGGTGGGDTAAGLALDSSNDAIVAGPTSSTDFPTTSGAYQSSNPQAGSGNTACYVSIVSSDGKTLLASSYLGGTGSPISGNGDAATAVTVDSTGEPIVVGTAEDGGFPTSSTAYQKTWTDNSACFIAKLSADGKTLVAGTLLSGSGNPSGSGEHGLSVALDGSQNIVVAGYSYSQDFPLSTGAYQTTNKAFSNSGSNAFVSKVSSDCSKLLSSTYLGGSAQQAGDQANSVAVDGSGNMLLGGQTGSTDFPITSGAFQLHDVEAPFCTTCFVAKVSADAKSLMGSTYLGGTNGSTDGDVIDGVSLDSAGNPVVTGYSDAGNFPVTAYAYQATNKGFVLTDVTAFVAKVTADCTRLLESTYLGGSGGDMAYGLTLDSSGNPVVAGYTASTDFPTSTGAYETSTTADGDGFITDLAFPAIVVALSPTAVVGGTSLTGQVVVSVPAGASGETVTFSSNTTAAKPPVSAPMPAFGSYLTFPITTIPVDSATVATITAKVGANSQSATVTVNAPTLTSVAFTPSSVVGGIAGSLTVNLSSAAGPDAAVALSGPGPWLLPSSVVVPAGQSSGTFSIATAGVNVSTTPTVSAKYGSITRTSTLTIMPAAISTYTATYASVVGGTAEGSTLTLNGKAGLYGDIVTFSSTGPVVLPAPVSVTYETTSAAISISTQPVSVATAASVTAKMGTVAKTINFTVTPAPIAAVSLPSAVLGGNSASCTISLSGLAGASGDTVTLSGTGSWTVPASEKVAAGATSVVFSFPTKAVSASGTATITATLGTSKVTASTTISEASVSYLIILPLSVVGGTSAFGIVSLNGPAGPTGDIVKLSGAGPWTLAPSVTVPPGQTGAYFVVTTTKVTTATSANITATLGASSAAASLTVTP